MENENFFNDNSDLKFHLETKDLRRVVELKEDFFEEKNHYPDAPEDYEDAIDSYQKVLTIMGEICGSYIAPRAADVDLEGATYSDGEVQYAKGMSEALATLKQSDLMGFTLPRKYGGLNIPKTIYSMAIEMISRADASLMNIFGLQDIAETIYKFGSEEQREKYLPRFTKGDVLGSMALTEPDAGSDLQAAQLKASFDPLCNQWKLNGVKRFITNGNAKISLVMARSEENSSDGRGLSLFIYERDSKMKIRRIEHKLGIHGSPTCELQFNDAPAELLGKRKFGLIKYTMSLMNGARLGVSAQAIGIAQAAYQEALLYAKNRVQFKRAIIELPPLFEMLTEMKIAIEAARALLIETAQMVDIKEGLEEREIIHPETATDIKEELKKYERYSSTFTPLLKSYATEMANRVTYDALQVHGGVGYTTDFKIERLVRDARITNIYEGTTQMQVVAAMGGIMKGVIFERLNEYENKITTFLNEESHSFSAILEDLKIMRTQLEKMISHLKSSTDSFFHDFHGRRIVDSSSEIVMSYLLVHDAFKSEEKRKSAEIFIKKAKSQILQRADFILSSDNSTLEKYKVLHS